MVRSLAAPTPANPDHNATAEANTDNEARTPTTRARLVMVMPPSMENPGYGDREARAYLGLICPAGYCSLPDDGSRRASADRG